MKKTWEAPKLVILVRTRPEESILSACKTNVGATGPNNFDEYCWNTACEACQDQVDS